MNSTPDESDPAQRPDEPGPTRPADGGGHDGDDPMGTALRRMGASTSVRQDGGLDVLATIGGWRGLVESVLPSAVFLVAFTVTTHLWGSGIAAVAVAAVFSLVRLIQRQSPLQALAGLAVVVLCVVVALNTGEARDYYIWGFVTNAVYVLGMSVSVFIGWPVLGLLFGLVRGEGVQWRHDRVRRRRYALATWLVVGALALRLVVQVPLYLADDLVALGTTRLVMGLPLYALALWLGWLISAPPGASPAGQERMEQPGSASGQHASGHHA